MFDVSIIGGAMILAVLVLKLLLKDRVPPGAWAIIWVIIFLRLLLPFQLETGLAIRLSGDIHSLVAQSVSRIAAGNDAQEAQTAGISGTNKAHETSGASGTSGASETSGTPSGTPSGISGSEISGSEASGSEASGSKASGSGVSGSASTLAYIWICGAAVLLAAVLVLYLRASRGLKGLKECSVPGIIQLVEKCRQIAGIKTKIRIYMTDEFNGACVLGILSPKLVLPESFDGRYPDDARENIILHEMYHIKHHDNALRLLFLITACLHWFNPLVWCALLCSRADNESACDEAVIKRLPESKIGEYGKTIIDLAAISNKWTSAVVYTGISASKSGLKQRIRNISHFGRRKLVWVAVSAMLIFMLAACGTMASLNGGEETKGGEQTNVKSSGMITVYPDAQPMMLAPVGLLDSALAFETGETNGDWVSVQQKDVSGWIPSWFIESGGIRPIKFIDSKPMVLKKDVQGLLYPGGPEIIELQKGKLLTPTMEWNGWRHVSIIVYDIPNVQFAWVRADDLTAPDKQFPMEGYLYEGDEVYVTADFTKINKIQPEKVNYRMSVYITEEKDGYIYVHAAGGWTAWTRKQNLKFENVQISQFSINTGTGILSISDWDDKVDLNGLLGEPISEEVITLGNEADTHAGSFVKTLKYDGLEVKLFSPKANGKAFWVMSMKVSSSKYSTAAGIKTGDDLDMLKQVYPDLERIPDGRTDDKNCAYTVSDPEEGYRFIDFEVKEGKIEQMRIYLSIP